MLEQNYLKELIDLVYIPETKKDRFTRPNFYNRDRNSIRENLEYQVKDASRRKYLDIKEILKSNDEQEIRLIDILRIAVKH